MASNTTQHVTVHSHLGLKSLFISTPVFIMCVLGASPGPSSFVWPALCLIHSGQDVDTTVSKNLASQDLCWQVTTLKCHYTTTGHIVQNPGGGMGALHPRNPLPTPQDNPHPCVLTGVGLVGLAALSNSWVWALACASSSWRSWVWDCTSLNSHRSCWMVVWASSHSQSIGHSPWYTINRCPSSRCWYACPHTSNTLW